MRMTQRKKQNASSKLSKSSGWGAEPVEEDSPADKTTELQSDKAALQKIEAELAEKRKAVEAEKAKLAPLEEEARKLRSAIERQRAEVVADHVDALLAIVPEHDFTSCSDQETLNEGRCTRCSLLYIKHNRWDAMNFKVDVTVTPR